ncbi:MAG TPA: immunoglobulin-like domain-containing protein [Chitinophagaceae bacterium]|nr:immunoglobulin-like domain-containing protein [Chitinophagaceae bacterium]
MKLINKFLLIGILPLLITSCEKDTEHVSKEVKVSFPTITLNGDEVVKLGLGATYTDAGAKLTDDISGAVTDILPVSNNVNTAEAGLYVVSYSAANANGFEATEARIVGVTNVTGTPDRSGTYLRAATGVNCIITKVADGLYKVQNPGGAAVGVNTIVYFVETAPNVFVCPTQPSVDGPFAVIEINFTATGATWKVQNAGYGTQLRTFVK